jgi:hypothetical protein
MPFSSSIMSTRMVRNDSTTCSYNNPIKRLLISTPATKCWRILRTTRFCASLPVAPLVAGRCLTRHRGADMGARRGGSGPAAADTYVTHSIRPGLLQRAVRGRIRHRGRCICTTSSVKPTRAKINARNQVAKNVSRLEKSRRQIPNPPGVKFKNTRKSRRNQVRRPSPPA